MGRIIAALLCASAFAQTPHDLAAEASRRADAAYWACRSRGGNVDCAAEQRAADAAFEACEHDIAQQLAAIRTRVEGATARVQESTARIQRYAVCQQARRWWQAWKPRCRY